MSSRRQAVRTMFVSLVISMSDGSKDGWFVVVTLWKYRLKVTSDLGLKH